MRAPLGWAGLFVVLGTASWPAWRPDAPRLLAGVLVMAALALIGRRFPAALLALGAGAFLVGAAAPAVIPPAAPLGRLAPVVGTVVRVRGHELHLQTDKGAMEVLAPYGAELPRVGQSVALLTEPAPRRVVLPGGPAELASDALAHRVRRKAVRMLVLGPTRHAPATDVFHLAEHGGLLRALATGDRSAVPDATTALLRRTGTAHLLAISGLHVGLVAASAWGLGSVLALPLAWLRWPRLVRVLPAAVSMGAAVAYAQAVSWPASARRAVWMVGAAAVARVLGRRVRAWNLLGLAAIGVVLVDPAEVGEVSFQLSFGAVAGILLVTPRLMRWLPPDLPRPVRWAAQSLATTLGALAGTLPITAWRFESLSPVAPLANLLATPLLAGLAVPGALVARLAPVPVNLVGLGVADLAAGAALRLLDGLDATPWAPAVDPLGALLLALAVLWVRRPAVAGLLALLALGVRPVPVDRLVVTFLSVGQGDSALVEWPDGRRWLIDGGPPSTRVLDYLRRREIRHLDAVFLSHPHPDHLGGLLPVVEALPIDELWVPRRPQNGESGFLSLWQRAWAEGARIKLPGAPGAVILSPLRDLPVRKRHEMNDQSLVLLVQYGARSFLFTGDIEKRTELYLLPRLSHVDVVKVAHHGSKSSSSIPFVAATHPELAVISCGDGNRFGHPAPQALARWRGVAVLRTDRDGTIEVSTDGADLRVRAWRPDTGWRPLHPRAWTPRASVRALREVGGRARRRHRRAHG